MRGRRGSRSAGVSLFAFQDVLTTVIGIMLLLVMLLATELSMVAEVVQADDTIKAQRAQLAGSLESALEAERLASARQSQLVRQIEGQSNRGRTALVEQIAEARRLTKEARIQRDAVNREIERLWHDVAASQEGGIADQVQVRNNLRAQVDRLRGSLDELARSTRLTYRITPGQQRLPIIVVAAADRFRIGGAGREQGVLDLTASDPSARLGLLRQLLTQQSPSDRYVLVVAKPSASNELLESINDLADSLGFELGFDLIPEEWSVLMGVGTEGEMP